MKRTISDGEIFMTGEGHGALRRIARRHFRHMTITTPHSQLKVFTENR